MGELFPFRWAGFPAGSSEGYPPEMVAMLQKCQAVRKHEVPGQGAGDWEGIEDNKKPPKNSSIGVFRRLFIETVYVLFLRKFDKVLYKF